MSTRQDQLIRYAQNFETNQEDLLYEIFFLIE
jgi:hypothetical protein